MQNRHALKLSTNTLTVALQYNNPKRSHVQQATTIGCNSTARTGLRMQDSLEVLVNKADSHVQLLWKVVVHGTVVNINNVYLL